MKLKIKNIDEESSFFGGRVLKVNRQFSTPLRISSSVDYRSKQEVPLDIKIDSPFSEVTSNFTTKEYENFLSNNIPFEKRLRVDEQKADLMSYSPLVSYYPQIPKEIRLNQKGMKLLLELALNVDGVNIVSIPMFEPERSYSDELQKYCSEVGDRGKEPMPILDMGLAHDDFKTKFDEICSNIDTGLVSIMGLVYRNWSSNVQNFYHVWENREKDILYYCMGVERKYENASTMHFLQSWGIDVYSVRMVRGYGGFERKINDVDVFDRNSLGVLKVKQYKGEYSDGSLNCDCKMCRNLDMGEFVEKYGRNHRGDLDGSQLQYAGKLHEFFSSSAEFDRSREAINENSLLDYFNSKKRLNHRFSGSLDNYI